MAVKNSNVKKSLFLVFCERSHLKDTLVDKGKYKIRFLPNKMLIFKDHFEESFLNFSKILTSNEVSFNSIRFW